MSHDNAKMFSRGIMLCAIFAMPLAAGCGGKPETGRDALPVSADPASMDPTSGDQISGDQTSGDQTSESPTGGGQAGGSQSSESQSAGGPRQPIGSGVAATRDGEAPVGPAFGDDPIRADQPVTEASPDVGSDAPETVEAERPQSLIRSIGRALVKGLTDATGGTSGGSNDAETPTESQPVEPR